MSTYIPTTQIHIPEGMIDLGVGDPDFALLPLDLLYRAAEICISKGDPTFLQYGAEQGDGYFRRALAGFLGGLSNRTTPARVSRFGGVETAPALAI